MPLRLLLGEGPEEMLSLAFSQLSPDQVFLAGTRDLDPAEERYIADHDLTLLPPAELADPEALIAAIRARGYTDIYLHLDLDILDPDDFPHLLIPVPGGVPLPHLLSLLEHLTESFTVPGASLVEYVPREGIEPAGLDRILDLLVRA